MEFDLLFFFNPRKWKTQAARNIDQCTKLYEIVWDLKIAITNC